MQSRHVTLVANTVTPVNMTESEARWVTVHVRSDHEVFFRTDGVDPTVEGNDCLVVHPRSPVQPAVIDQTNSPSVRLISTGPAKVSVVAEQR